MALSALTTRPPLAVLDTNVVLDWLVFREPAVAPLAAAIGAGQIGWLACSGMRQELAQMLSHASLERWQPDAVAALACFDRLVTPAATPALAPALQLRCTDPDDQVFLDLAIACGARWLLSHDRAVLKLARRAAGRGLAILRPSDWHPSG